MQKSEPKKEIKMHVEKAPKQSSSRKTKTEAKFARITWKNLLKLRYALRNRITGVTAVSNARRYVMQGLLDALDAEVMRSEIEGEKIEGKFTLSITVNITPIPSKGQVKPSKRRTIDDLIKMTDRPLRSKDPNETEIKRLTDKGILEW